MILVLRAALRFPFSVLLAHLSHMLSLSVAWFLKWLLSSAVVYCVLGEVVIVLVVVAIWYFSQSVILIL